jgi:hypothetical protein
MRSKAFPLAQAKRKGKMRELSYYWFSCVYNLIFKDQMESRMDDNHPSLGLFSHA